MSLLDSIKNAGNGLAHLGSDVVKDAEKVGSTVVNDAEKIGSTAVTVVQAGEHAAVKTIQAQADVVRFGLEKSFNEAEKVGTTAIKLTAAGLDEITHPGDPNPPAAQGLKFSETKSAVGLAYGAKPGEVYKFPNGKQWKVVDLSEDKKSGFRAIALQPTDPNDKRTVVAFAGTDPKSGKDWITDIKQGIGFQTKQYQEAVGFANKWKESAGGNNVILTGHSLGGGLASYASIKTGLHATALNAAPLALNHLGGNPLNSSVRNNQNITQYYVPGEVLTNIDVVNPLDVRPGNKIAVQGKYSILNPLEAILNHSSGSAAPNIPDPVRVP